MEDELALRRLLELAERSAARGVYTNSEFLTLAQKAALAAARPAAPYVLDGGYEGAERAVAVFGSRELCGWSRESPVCCVEIAPLSPKFAEELSHRDYLGALMGLGVRRETMGDILTEDGKAWLFCLDSIGDFVTAELHEVRRTSVAAKRSKPPAAASAPPEISEAVVSSERLDALAAAVFSLSRAESQELFPAGRVFVNGRETKKPDAVPAPGDIVSVRGFGRFVYVGPGRETRRGRMRVQVRVWK